jgi:Zn-dependent membrane protease YugP
VHLVIVAVLVFGLVVAPGLWVQAVMKRHRVPADRYAKTGGQVARELLDSSGLRDVATEKTDRGDHYDPVAKAVRLSADNFDGRSLTALAIAAHEVGHALQDARGFKPLRWRTRLVRWVHPIERVGAGLMMIAPFSALLTRSRAFAILTFVAGFATLVAGVLVHLVTLPTELDASFRRALPLVEKRGVLLAEDLPGARKLLTAAAFTYVAVALQSLLNIARWWAILRR